MSRTTEVISYICVLVAPNLNFTLIFVSHDFLLFWVGSPTFQDCQKVVQSSQNQIEANLFMANPISVHSWAGEKLLQDPPKPAQGSPVSPCKFKTKKALKETKK